MLADMGGGVRGVLWADLEDHRRSSKKMRRSWGDIRSIVKFCNVLVFLQKITKKNNCRPKFPAPRVYDFAASCLQWVSCHLRPHNFTTGSGTACHAIPQQFVYRISQVNRYIYIYDICVYIYVYIYICIYIDICIFLYGIQSYTHIIIYTYIIHIL